MRNDIYYSYFPTWDVECGTKNVTLEGTSETQKIITRLVGLGMGSTLEKVCGYQITIPALIYKTGAKIKIEFENLVYLDAQIYTGPDRHNTSTFI